ncbi:hypothetical protein DBR11_20045 [Pedobacter sp. HMWF019]|uniref:CDP-glycerol glycerophosphotransferase family protein n=1 Tax=Pedobacter sp. HMWF019 TaxID=2056856 RepID=UPI000D37D252|nr:CDP-glycerol glycerophosphotransferase family protein [Pedobacter sp. HMWF019]PTS95976.1 hypothetical protein DBR11_20045 [Pedobacter sp. HMWF019]
MRPRLKGKVLFVFSDPGGAKPCLSLIAEDGISDVLVISDRSYSFYGDFGVPVSFPDATPLDIINDFKPEVIFTGTSYTSDLELCFISLAKQLGIPCISFVDHWTSIAKRFLMKDGEFCFPDFIWVIDQRAKEIAIKDGIDSSLVIISGNPYHQWLSKWLPKVEKNQYLEKISSDIEFKKIVVFAPDPLSNINGKSTYGFDELTATSKFMELLEQRKEEIEDWAILIKMHPNQQIEGLKKITENYSFVFLVESTIDVNETIFFADIVVGFFSSFLIEAQIMGKPVVRFIGPDTITDPFEELNVGIKAGGDTLITEILKYV